MIRDVSDLDQMPLGALRSRPLCVWCYGEMPGFHAIRADCLPQMRHLPRSRPATRRRGPPARSRHGQKDGDELLSASPDKSMTDAIAFLIAHRKSHQDRLPIREEGSGEESAPSLDFSFVGQPWWPLVMPDSMCSKRLLLSGRYSVKSFQFRIRGIG